MEPWRQPLAVSSVLPVSGFMFSQAVFFLISSCVFFFVFVFVFVIPTDDFFVFFSCFMHWSFFC